MNKKHPCFDTQNLRGLTMTMAASNTPTQHSNALKAILFGEKKAKHTLPNKRNSATTLEKLTSIFSRPSRISITQRTHARSGSDIRTPAKHTNNNPVDKQEDMLPPPDSIEQKDGTNQDFFTLSQNIQDTQKFYRHWSRVLSKAITLITQNNINKYTQEIQNITNKLKEIDQELNSSIVKLRQIYDAAINTTLTSDTSPEDIHKTQAKFKETSLRYKQLIQELGSTLSKLDHKQDSPFNKLAERLSAGEYPELHDFSYLFEPKIQPNYPPRFVPKKLTTPENSEESTEPTHINIKNNIETVQNYILQSEIYEDYKQEYGENTHLISEINTSFNTLEATLQETPLNTLKINQKITIIAEKTLILIKKQSTPNSPITNIKPYELIPRDLNKKEVKFTALEFALNPKDRQKIIEEKLKKISNEFESVFSNPVTSIETDAASSTTQTLTNTDFCIESYLSQQLTSYYDAYKATNQIVESNIKALMNAKLVKAANLEMRSIEKTLAATFSLCVAAGLGSGLAPLASIGSLGLSALALTIGRALILDFKKQLISQNLPSPILNHTKNAIAALKVQLLSSLKQHYTTLETKLKNAKTLQEAEAIEQSIKDYMDSLKTLVQSPNENIEKSESYQKKLLSIWLQKNKDIISTKPEKKSEMLMNLRYGSKTVAQETRSYIKKKSIEKILNVLTWSTPKKGKEVSPLKYIQIPSALIQEAIDRKIYEASPSIKHQLKEKSKLAKITEFKYKPNQHTKPWMLRKETFRIYKMLFINTNIKMKEEEYKAFYTAMQQPIKNNPEEDSPFKALQKVAEETPSFSEKEKEEIKSYLQQLNILLFGENHVTQTFEEHLKAIGWKETTEPGPTIPHEENIGRSFHPSASQYNLTEFGAPSKRSRR